MKTIPEEEMIKYLFVKACETVMYLNEAEQSFEDMGIYLNDSVDENGISKSRIIASWCSSMDIAMGLLFYGTGIVMDEELHGKVQLAIDCISREDYKDDIERIWNDYRHGKVE